MALVVGGQVFQRNRGDLDSRITMNTCAQSRLRTAIICQANAGTGRVNKGNTNVTITKRNARIIGVIMLIAEPSVQWLYLEPVMRPQICI